MWENCKKQVKHFFSWKFLGYIMRNQNKSLRFHGKIWRLQNLNTHFNLTRKKSNFTRIQKAFLFSPFLAPTGSGPGDWGTFKTLLLESCFSRFFSSCSKSRRGHVQMRTGSTRRPSTSPLNNKSSIMILGLFWLMRM